MNHAYVSHDTSCLLRYTLWFKKRPLDSYGYSFHKCQSISIIFGTRCTELICNITVIDLPTTPMYCCYTTLGNLGLCSKGVTEQSHLWMHKALCPTFVIPLDPCTLR